MKDRIKYPSFIFSLILLFFACAGVSSASPLLGFDYPLSALSYANQVVDYDPNFLQTNQISSSRADPANALGMPDFNDLNRPGKEYVSLGNGGRLTLRFTESYLTGSGDEGWDLVIFEIGSDVENVFVEISRDNQNWFQVGSTYFENAYINPDNQVYGTTAFFVDIDSLGLTRSDLFSFVRLTDDIGQQFFRGGKAGADIDAVGLLSAVSIDEPTTAWLLVIGLFGVFLLRNPNRIPATASLSKRHNPRILS
ncbi:MAG: hypothetical protein KZQ88_17400 [Candidatus Thiodiazotropha sp. (ex Dulcina madagascariensis)]|nr:hypothetical protein [Candidatus Thiodiazotropha sp. (ex Dulcina madagascariensis)]MCU7925713.1 hypothetical protein [Candidatus Thiodiazotropha sp. (ex Dulcina madagascariensis)]